VICWLGFAIAGFFGVLSVAIGLFSLPVTFLSIYMYSCVIEDAYKVLDLNNIESL